MSAPVDDAVFVARLDQCSSFRRALEVLTTRISKSSTWGDGGDGKPTHHGVIGRFEISSDGLRVFIDTAEQALQGSSSFAKEFFSSFVYTHPDPSIVFEIDLTALTTLITPPKDASSMPPVTLAYPYKASLYPAAPVRPGQPPSYLTAATSSPFGSRRRPAVARVEVESALCVSFCADGAVVEAFLETSPANPLATTRLDAAADAADPVVKLTCYSGLLRTAVLPDSLSLTTDADDTVGLTASPNSIEFTRSTAVSSRTVAVRADARDVGEYFCNLSILPLSQPSGGGGDVKMGPGGGDPVVKAERASAAAARAGGGASAADGRGSSVSSGVRPSSVHFSYIGKHLITALKSIRVGSTEWSQLTVSPEGLLRVAHRLVADSRTGSIVQVAFVMLSLLPEQDSMAL